MMTAADITLMDAMVAAGWSAAMIVDGFRAALARQSGVVAESRDAPPAVASVADPKERKREADRKRMAIKRAAARQAIADRQPDLFPVTLAVANEATTSGDMSRDASPPSLKEKFPPAPPSKENNPSPKIDDAADRTRVVSMISAEAKKLADELGAIAGIDPDPMACPPGWCGAALQVQAWLSGGWSAAVILDGARVAMTRKRDGPPETVNYFAKPIAKLITQPARPPPTVEKPHERPRQQPRKTMLDAFAELAAKFESEDRASARAGPDRMLPAS